MVNIANAHKLSINNMHSYKYDKSGHTYTWGYSHKPYNDNWS